MSNGSQQSPGTPGPKTVAFQAAVKKHMWLVLTFLLILIVVLYATAKK